MPSYFCDTDLCFAIPFYGLSNLLFCTTWNVKRPKKWHGFFFFLNSWNTNTLWNFLFIMKEFGPLNECSTMCTMCSAVNIVLFCVLQYLISGLLNWSSSKKCRDSVLCESAVGSCLKYTVQRFSYKSEAFCFII